MTGRISRQSGDSGNTRPRFWTAWNCSWKKKETKESQPESVEALLDTVENEELLQILLSTDKKTLQMIVLKMMGYAPKRDQSSYGTAGADGLYKTAEVTGKRSKSP